MNYSIVFVHGITGNRENTWTHKGTGIFWPKQFLGSDIPTARILTFGYDADVAHFWSMASHNRIGNHAENLVNSLAQWRDRTKTVRYMESALVKTVALLMRNGRVTEISSL